MAKKPITEQQTALLRMSAILQATDAIIHTLNDLIRAISQLDLTIREHIATTTHEKRRTK